MSLDVSISQNSVIKSPKIKLRDILYVVDMLILRQTLAQIYGQKVLYVLYGLETAEITCTNIGH
jgi:hypothetical protein